MTKIERKVYDEEGTETVLGLPCKTVVEYWNGEINSDGVHIDDAFNIDVFDVTDDHSTSVLALAAEIAVIQALERCVVTGFTTPVVTGYHIDEDGNADTSSLVEDTLTEVELTDPITIDGVNISKVYKGSGNVSLYNISSSVLMDSRNTMDGYTTDSATDCVYKILSTEEGLEIALLLDKTIDDSNSIDVVTGNLNYKEELTTNDNILVCCNSKLSLNDGIVISSNVGIGGNIPGSFTYSLE